MTESVPNFSKWWIAYAAIACIGFTISNTYLSVLSESTGPFVFFYWCSGAIAVILVHNLFYCFYNKFYVNGKFWFDFNLMKKGKIVPLNVFGFCCLALVMFFNQNMVNISMWTSHLANINVGVISVIWTLNPLIQALVDYYLINQRLTSNLWIGMILLAITSVLLSLQPLILDKE